MVAVWATTVNIDSSYFRRIFANWSDDGGETWGGAQLLSEADNSYAPQLAMSDLIVVAVWNDSGGNSSICSNRSTDGGETWLGIQMLDNGAVGGKDGQQIAMSDSDVVAVWYQGAGGIKVHSNRSADGGASWDGAQIVDDSNTGDAPVPQIALSGDNAIVVWQRFDGTATRIYASCSGDGAANWSSAELIQDDVAACSFSAHVAADGTNAIAVWNQQESVVDVYSNHLSLLETPPQFIGSWGTSAWRRPVQRPPGSGQSRTARSTCRTPTIVASRRSAQTAGSSPRGVRTGRGRDNSTSLSIWRRVLTVPSMSVTATTTACNTSTRKADTLGSGASIGDSRSGPREFNWTFGIATDQYDNVYVTDWGNERVQEYRSDGDYVTLWDSGIFEYPFGLATDASENVYVAEWAGNRIQKFDGDEWKVLSDSTGLHNPSGIAVDGDGNVYVCDTGNNRIQVLDADGQLLTQFGAYGSDYGQFDAPMGIAIHPNGDIYVADSGNNRIQVFSYSTPDEIELDLKAGWNMVSVPLALFPSNSAPAVVFQGENDGIYGWNPDAKSYETPDTIEPEVGYWVHMTADKTISIAGAPMCDWNSDLTTGWNMVGSVCGDPVAVSALDDDPDGSILTGSIYGWNPTAKSYDTAGQIVQGMGYWMSTTVDCCLTMCAPPPVP